VIWVCFLPRLDLHESLLLSGMPSCQNYFNAPKEVPLHKWTHIIEHAVDRPNYKSRAAILNNHTHNHFTAIFGNTQVSQCQKKSSSGLYGASKNKVIEADTCTIRIGTTPSGPISDPPPSSLIFTLDALPAATLPIYRALGQEPNMLMGSPPMGCKMPLWLAKFLF